jgi:glycosyltransferase involved in cell wall biosynthesis
MKYITLILAALFCQHPIQGYFIIDKQVPLYVVIPSYNNERYCIENLNSLTRQKYFSWKAVYINDCSEDRTGELVEEFIKKNRLQKKIRLIQNKRRCGALENTYNAIKKVDPHSVVIILDGDDYLIDDHVFEYIAQIYKKNPHIWLTYGNYIAKPNPRRSVCAPYPEEVIRNHSFRNHKYISSHLRTFYAALFQKINKKDLLYKGKFFQAAGDVAAMLPMLEMAAHGHFVFINKLLYVYRDNNPINDFKKHGALQRKCNRIIRSRPVYEPLTRLW